ncbi:MAG: hypothetical protein IKG94_02840 [Candidatus Methanomethylophilaceae archaeon]|nr:hypothetical protein [Candidatus Methanomethylophilaceae archaeon]MBR4225306.1 hypothetical protein [Candidatus Methanomethylophilaceae archaeon]
MSRDMYCPYCGKVVRTGAVSWFWLLAGLLTGHLILYLLYCLLIGSRICRECDRRIYGPGMKR